MRPSRDPSDPRERGLPGDARRQDPSGEPADPRPAPASQQRIIALQQSAGNAAVGRLLRAEVGLTDAERGRVQAARAFWQRLASTPAAQQNVPAQIEAAPAEIREALPPEADAGGAAAPENDPYKNRVQQPASEAAEDGAGAGGRYDAKVSVRPPDNDPYKNRVLQDEGGDAAAGSGDLAAGSGPEARPAGPPKVNDEAASKRARTVWAGVGKYVHTVGSAETKILPGRQGPVKQLEWFQYWLEAIDEKHRPGHDLAAHWSKWVASGAQESFWQYLDHVDKDPTRKVEYHVTAKERAQHMVLIKDGKLWKKKPEAIEAGAGEPDHPAGRSDDYEPYDTSSANATYGNASGWAIFVVSTAGVFYSSNSEEGKLHHSSFLGGASVRAAGEIRVIGGTVEGLTPLSGHYRPGNDHLAYALGQLDARGAGIGAAKVGHVTVDADGLMTIDWFAGADYLANGSAGTKVAKPKGRSPTE